MKGVIIAGMLALQTVSAAVSLEQETIYTGMCDASAGVAVGKDLFVVADDESNDLKVYSQKRGGPPVGKIGLASFLNLKKKKDETDVEGAADMGEIVYWITSHGRNKNGKERPSRQFFFATKRSGETLAPVGEPYRNLLADLSAEPELRKYRLGEASQSWWTRWCRTRR